MLCSRVLSASVIAYVVCCTAFDYGVSSSSQPTRRPTSTSERIGRTPGRSRPVAAPPESLAALSWPEGTQVLRFEDLEGAILVPATLTPRSGRDTSGVFVLDTGAGFVAVDHDLARLLGIADGAEGPAAVGLAARPLARLQLGALQVDQVYPVQTVDAGIVRRVTGRPVLGLLGQALFRDRVVVLDYREGTLVVLPPEAHPSARSPVAGGAMSPAAVAVPFRLAGDGKVLVTSRVFARPRGTGGAPPRSADPGPRSGGRLTLIVDTGATKTFFFRAALDRRLPGWTTWPSLRGLGAPTLTGDAGAELVRVDRIELGLPGARVARSGMDAAVLGGGLGKLLASDVGEPVDGLLGYSFLKHFRVALDYPRGLLWLDPTRGDVEDRPGEYCHPGLQLESVAGAVRIMAVAEGSPAALAGIRAGDELVEIDGDPLAGIDLVIVSRRLEGAPGTALSLRLRRGSEEWVCRVVRRCLL